MTNLTNGDDTFNGGNGDDVVNGLGGNDTISGNDGDDIINGGAGDDTIYGGANDDTLTGGSGDDILDGGTGDDTFIGGSGTNDTVVIHVNAADASVSHNGTQLILTSADGVDTINSSVEHIQFNDFTIDISGGDALAHLQADGINLDEEGGYSGNVLDNDVDIDDAMTVTAIYSDNESTSGTLGDPLTGQYGSLTLNADGSYSYTADPSTNGLGDGESVQDVFTYTVTSGGVETTQTLTLTINGVNDAPTIDSGVVTPVYTDTAGDDSFSNTTGTVTASDDDTTDTLTFGVAFGDTLGGGDDALGGYDTSVQGDYGTLYINSVSGAYDYVVDDAAVEAAKTTNHDIFTFTISDGNGGSDNQAFDVTINGVNDTPELDPIAAGDINDTAADDTFADVAGTMTGSDRDNDPFTFRGIGQVVDGSQAHFNRSIAGTYGTLYFNINNGNYKYVANDSAVEGLKTDATDTFQMRLNDASSTIKNLVINLHGVNDTPDVFGSTGATLTEAGGVLNGTVGTDTSFLTVTLADRDTGDTATFDDSALVTDGWSTSNAGVTYTKTGTYGTATLTTADGHVDYQLNDSDSDTQALDDGDLVEDDFTVWGTDGTAGNSVVVGFSINGANDAAVVTGQITGDATEASGVANGTAGSAGNGDVSHTDVDADDADDVWQAVSTPAASDNGYGTYAIDASGNWTFTLNEGNATIEALNTGDSTSDTFTVLTGDGTTQQITVTIHGANDAAVVAGDTEGEVQESGGPLSPGDSPITGNLTDTDVDNADDTFQAIGSTASDNGYGTYFINGAGHWTYKLSNGNAAVQALNDGDTLTDTFTATTADGTTQQVTITINGQNEVFEGTGGDDFLKGSQYGDTFSGHVGDDIYVVNNAADIVYEAFDAGEDLIRSSVSYTLSANVENLVLNGSGNIDGTGNELDNLMIGNASKNTLDGEGGDDTLKGGKGGDTLHGCDGDDIMNGGDGNDTVTYFDAAGPVTVSLAVTSFQNTGGAGFDKINQVENIVGSDFADTLTGNTGKNVITGGGDGDTLTGGLGNDVFVYHDASESVTGVADTITDLTNGDKIDLHDVDSAFTIVGAFSNSAHELTLTFDGTNTTIAGDIDGDGVADIVIIATGDHHTYTNFVF